MMEVDDELIDACAQCNVKAGAAVELARDELDFQMNKTCGHKFCKNCLNDIFMNQGKRQFACARCQLQGMQTMVKKEKLSKKSLDSIEVDKDVRIRRKIKSIFNRIQEDFASLEEFNNYEEEVEDCIFNLVHDVNVETTRSKILQYQKDNEEHIVLNQGKAFEEDSKMERRVQQERELLELTYQDRIVKERQERSFKAERSRQMNEIALGERDKLTVTKSGGDAMEVDVAAGASAEEQARMQQQAMAHFSSHSALLRILENRPAPKVISSVVKTEQQSSGSMSKADKLLMYAAGGYSHKEWFKKSWASGFPDAALPRGWA